MNDPFHQGTFLLPLIISIRVTTGNKRPKVLPKNDYQNGISNFLDIVFVSVNFDRKPSNLLSLQFDHDRSKIMLGGSGCGEIKTSSFCLNHD